MNNFKLFESTHYHFYAYENSLAEAEIEKIKATQESSWKRITAFLGVSTDHKIDYFLYPSNQLKGELMGDDGNGNAFPEKFKVHAVYNEETKCIGAHEDAHILALPLGLPPQLFKEGLAEYMAGDWDGKPHDWWVLKFINENKVPNLADLIDDEYWYEADELISYPIAGSFIGFLVNQIGKNDFLKLYSSMNRDFV